MPEIDLIWGVDSGGTGLKGCLIDRHGELLAALVAPPANYASLRQDVVRPLDKLLRALQQTAAVAEAPAALAGICSTGVGRPADRELVRDAVLRARLAIHVVVESDAMAALTGAFAGAPGIIVIAGTGAVAYTRTANNAIVRVGGWGYLLGDEGSGYALARNAVNAALQDWDGRGATTVLRRLLEQHFDLPSIELIIDHIYSPGFDRGRMAQLVPLVFAAADAGDSVAQQLVQQTGTALGTLASTAARQFDAGAQVSVALIGGLFKRGDLLLPAFWQEAEKSERRLTIVTPRYPPEIGAAIFAMQSAGLVLDEDFFARLSEGLNLYSAQNP